MLRLWRAYRGSMTAPGHLLEGGGIYDQPAVMLDAFDLMSAAADEIFAERRREGARP